MNGWYCGFFLMSGWSLFHSDTHRNEAECVPADVLVTGNLSAGFP